jgi:hypothetical protein
MSLNAEYAIRIVLESKEGLELIGTCQLLICTKRPNVKLLGER